MKKVSRYYKRQSKNFHNIPYYIYYVGTLDRYVIDKLLIDILDIQDDEC